MYQNIKVKLLNIKEVVLHEINYKFLALVSLFVSNILLDSSPEVNIIQCGFTVSCFLLNTPISSIVQRLYALHAVPGFNIVTQSTCNTSCFTSSFCFCSVSILDNTLWIGCGDCLICAIACSLKIVLSSQLNNYGDEDD